MGDLEQNKTMDAVVFNGPFKINVERRPIPTIREPTDAIVKVEVAGICGSELHMYRGHQATDTGHVMGHEFVGRIVQAGKNVQKHQTGDLVISIFSVICNTCWFCIRGNTNRCTQGAAFGTQLLDGGQAEFVRVPHADGTLRSVPSGLDPMLGIMMSDILPTGYYGATNALEGYLRASGGSSLPPDFVLVCIGCGPVGLCAILTAHHRGVKTIYAVDSVDERLKEAQKFGAKPLKLGRDDVQKTVMEATDGRGADAVVELVGNKSALRSAFEMLRPAGHLSSVGFHQGDLPFTALECYQKNLNVNFGRAAVGLVFDDALKLLLEYQELLGDFITHKMSLAQAADGYALFEQHKARKVALLL